MTMFRLHAMAFIAAWTMMLGAPAAPAAAADAMKLNADQTAEINAISARLDALKSLRGRFTQIGPGGEFAEGTFYLQRPGKIRFEYAPPNPILVIADGFWVGIEDRKLRQTEKYPLSATPLSILLDEKVDLLKEARIVAFEQMPDTISVTVEDTSGLAPGQLTLFFGGPDMGLKQWIVIDAQGLKTEVSVFDLVAGISNDPKLFWINDNVLLDTGNR